MGGILRNCDGRKTGRKAGRKEGRQEGRKAGRKAHLTGCVNLYSLQRLPRLGFARASPLLTRPWRWAKLIKLHLTMRFTRKFQRFKAHGQWMAELLELL